jgi:hypothetical protein
MAGVHAALASLDYEARRPRAGVARQTLRRLYRRAAVLAMKTFRGLALGALMAAVILAILVLL